MKLIIFIRDISKKFPFLVITNTILLLLASFIDAASIFSLIVIVDLLVNPSLQGASNITKTIIGAVKSVGLPYSLSWILALLLFFNILKVCFQIFGQYFIFKTRCAVLREIMIGTFEDFFNARWYFFSSSKQGMFIGTFINEINVVGQAFGVMIRYFSNILQIIIYLVVPFFISWQVTSIILIIALLFILPFFLVGKISYRWGKINTLTANQISTVVQEHLSLAKLVLGFGNQSKSIKSLESAYDAHTKTTVKSNTLSLGMPLMYYPLGLLVLIIGMFVAKKLSLPLSEMAILFYSLTRIMPLFGNLTEQKACLDNFFPSYEQVLSLKRRARELRQISGNRLFQGFANQIALEDLSFAYPGHELTLTNINVVIPKGKMIAFVGGSGTGKSTLIDMIMGFNEPVSGKITFDGFPLQEFEINSYRQRIGYVPQDSTLFNTTIRDNLCWVKDDASEDEIRHACQQANAEEFIKKFPKGYDTLVGDRGIRLSGGQTQRIALARAILRKPELLILDEATSALDTHSERLIQQAMESIAKETTLIVVAHRLSTIINADYIYVLKDGRIVEEGTYTQLIERNGDFNRMVQLQTLETVK